MERRVLPEQIEPPGLAAVRGPVLPAAVPARSRSRLHDRATEMISDIVHEATYPYPADQVWRPRPGPVAAVVRGAVRARGDATARRPHVRRRTHLRGRDRLRTGAWDRLPGPSRDTFVHNAPTFLAEIDDPDALRLDFRTLSTFRGPVLLSQGDRSPPLFAPIVDRVAAALPQAVRHTFAGAGHVPHLTHPLDYADRVGAFLASAGSSAFLSTPR